ncbi:LysM peptidoglycan-binding domain-containing protein [Streptomyces olivaceoviridis]
MNLPSAGRTAGPPRILSGLLTALLAVLTLTGPAVSTANAEDKGLIKVYVVRSAAQNGGAADTLPEIAQRTLGSPARSQDIFTLNQGRAQTDGGALTSPDQTLDPGWILRLPDDASGPFVKLARDNSTSPDTSVGGIRIPIVLAVLGGVLLLLLTLLILLRRQAGRLARSFGRAAKTLGARIVAPGRRRRGRRLRRNLARRWHGDTTGPGAVRAALTEAAGAVPTASAGPVAADLASDGVRVLPAPDLPPPPPWQADGEHGWLRPRWTDHVPDPDETVCRPVRVGGSADRQTFVDLSYCDSVVALTGDPAMADEVLAALLAEITTYHPDLRVAMLGARPAGVPERVGQFRHSSELARLIGPEQSVFDAPVLPAAQRHRLSGVVAVSASVSRPERAEVARLCGARGNTWLALVVGDVPGAHWRCEVHRDGTMHLPWLDRTLIATA